MTIEWLAGNRIRGTSAERTSTTGIGNAVGGWKEVGRTTLGSAGDIIDIASLPNKRYYMVLENILGDSGEVSPEITFNGDTGTNYPIRRSNNGGTDWTSTTYNYMYNAYGGTISDRFIVGYIANKSDKEKLYQHHQCINVNRSNAGTAPDRNELASKWVNTSDPIDQITVTNSGGGSFDTGSEVVVLGWDPADTHSTNFWEELTSVDLSSVAYGTITSKKYLWFQASYVASGGTLIPQLQVGNGGLDTTSNYSERVSTNGGADGAGAPRADISINPDTLDSGENGFVNGFIINNSANEKLMMGNTVHTSTAEATTAPVRREWVGKWANTSNQIDTLGFIFTGTGTATGTLKIWGSD